MSNVHTSTRGDGGWDEQTFLWLRTQWHNELTTRVEVNRKREREHTTPWLCSLAYFWDSIQIYSIWPLLCILSLFHTTQATSHILDFLLPVIVFNCEMGNTLLSIFPEVVPWLILIKMWVTALQSAWCFNTCLWLCGCVDAFAEITTLLWRSVLSTKKLHILIILSGLSFRMWSQEIHILLCG